MNGTFNLVDQTHVSFFNGTFVIEGSFPCADSTQHVSYASGYVVLDSTTVPSVGSFVQGTVFGRGYTPTWVNLPKPGTRDGTAAPADPTAQWGAADPPIQFTDSTWVGGTWVDGTYVDGTRLSRWYDPLWVNYSMWYTQNPAYPVLIGYRYNEPVRVNVGDYYVSAVVPRPTGKYEIRWRYQKTYEHGGFGGEGFGEGGFGGLGPTKDSYAHEVVMPFTCISAGIDPDATGPFGFGAFGFGESFFGG
jgi:hypothetical protein